MHASSSSMPRDPTPDPRQLRYLWWILLIGLVGCFVGHGAFGVITKAAWVPYFAVAGISEPTAWRLMPWVGAMDIAIGLAALAWPCRAVFIWAVIWATWTALLRPLAGESIWEFIERAGNYGVPLALLTITGWRGSWFSRRTRSNTPILSPSRVRELSGCLRLTTAALLAGHGGCGAFLHKASLGHLYASVWPAAPTLAVPAVGAFEFLLALAVLLVPRPALLVAVCVWKLSTESLFLVAGAPFWEVIERFGSYTAPLALALLLARRTPSPSIAPAFAR